MRVIFHADAGRDEGLGHLRECLSVADVLKASGVQAEFILPQESESAQQDAATRGYNVHGIPASDWQHGKAEKLAGLISAKPTGVVANLFVCGTSYAQTLNAAAVTWATITEHSHEELAPLNFNICLRPELMPVADVWRDVDRREAGGLAGNVLICFGGSDPKNATGLVLEFLRQGLERGTVAQDFCLHVVIGPFFEHGAAIRGLAASYPRHINVQGPLTPAALCLLARSMDIAVTTGGGTMYEFSAIGLPCIIIPILDKMAANAAPLAEYGAVIATRRIDYITADDFIEVFNRLMGADERAQLSRLGREVIDGRGAERIAHELIKKWRLTSNHV